MRVSSTIEVENKINIPFSMQIRFSLLFILSFINGLWLLSCSNATPQPPTSTQPIDNQTNTATTTSPETPFLVILGTTQDAGSPQIGCKKSCCQSLFSNPDKTRQVVSVGLVDPVSQSSWLFEATPDIKTQLRFLQESIPAKTNDIPDGIFITHAHMGHYSGLLQLGKEAINADAVPVYAMPKMQSFLTNNAPWSQLIATRNINLQPLQNNQPVAIGHQIKVTPLQVPHRDEFSETVGFKIQTPNKIALFIPDIDKWDRWNTDINDLIKEVDYALLDATFFDNKELPGRDMSQIPHPFVVESMNRFDSLSPTDKAKIYFIHFNHTNPLLDKSNVAQNQVKTAGYNIATYGLRLPM